MVLVEKRNKTKAFFLINFNLAYVVFQFVGNLLTFALLKDGKVCSFLWVVALLVNFLVIFVFTYNYRLSVPSFFFLYYPFIHSY